jgi:hypothetical protein
MTRVNISIILLLILGFTCKKESAKTFFFIYEENRFGNKRYFKIEKQIDVSGHETRLYHDHLDSNFISSETPRKILFKKNKNTLSYLFYQFPINRNKIDACHTYKYYIQENSPPFVYKICLIRNIQDTVINNRTIKNASLYKLTSLDNRVDNINLNLIFDWNLEILIEEKSIESNIKLMKIY